MGEDIKKGIGDALTWIENKLLQTFEYIRSGKAKQDWEDFKQGIGTAVEVFMLIFGVVSKVVGAVMEFTAEHPKIAGMVGAFALFSPILAPIAVALAGFLSPWPFIGWLPIGAGLCWAAYDLVDVKDTPTDGNTSRTAPRPER